MRYFLILFFVMITGCTNTTNPEPIIIEVTREVEIPITVTVDNIFPFPVPTIIVTQTNTSGPSPTPSNSPTITPSPILTPTPTPTPWLLSNCVKLKLDVPRDFSYEIINPQFEKYNDECVKLIYLPYFDGYVGFNYIYPFLAKTILDGTTPADVISPSSFSHVWGIFNISPSGIKTIALRRVEKIQSNQSVIQDKGLYSVGEGLEMSPGLWISAVPETWTDSCYWARSNANSGNTISSHYGIAGMTIRVFEGQVFDTNDECAPWFYVGP